METGAGHLVREQARRRRSVADVQSILSRSRNQPGTDGTGLHAISEVELPQPQGSLLSATNPNAQTMVPLTAFKDQTTDVRKKSHRRSSVAGVQADGPVPERKPVSQVRSFMEVKRSEEALTLKAVRLEALVTSLQAALSQEQKDALDLRAEVLELKARLSEVEKDKDVLTNRCSCMTSELAQAQSELKELKENFERAREDCAAAKIEAASSTAAASAATEKLKALTEVLQRRGNMPHASLAGTQAEVGVEDLVFPELLHLQARVHEQDEFASCLNEMHIQVEKTRQEIRARLLEASERACALGLGGIETAPVATKPALSLVIEPEISTSASMEGECTPDSNQAEGTPDHSSSQKSLSRQLSDLSALSRRSSVPGWQSEDSNEMSPEYVSLLAIPEAAKSLVAVKSQTQFDSPIGTMATSPAYHRRKSSDISNGCTQDLSQRFEAQGILGTSFLKLDSIRVQFKDDGGVAFKQYDQTVFFALQHTEEEGVLLGT